MQYTIDNDTVRYDQDIVNLILGSKSIEEWEEKQKWFELLPIMRRKQKDRLREILLEEKRKMKEIEDKYSSL